MGVSYRCGMRTEEITNRLKRIEGQVRGLQRMVAEQRDCEAILTQLMAARAALDRVGLMVADSFVEQCIVDADGDLSRERVRRVLDGGAWGPGGRGLAHLRATSSYHFGWWAFAQARETLPDSMPSVEPFTQNDE